MLIQISPKLVLKAMNLFSKLENASPECWKKKCSVHCKLSQGEGQSEVQVHLLNLTWLSWPVLQDVFCLSI